MTSNAPTWLSPKHLSVPPKPEREHVVQAGTRASDLEPALAPSRSQVLRAKRLRRALIPPRSLELGRERRHLPPADDAPPSNPMSRGNGPTTSRTLPPARPIKCKSVRSRSRRRGRWPPSVHGGPPLPLLRLRVTSGDRQTAARTEATPSPGLREEAAIRSAGAGTGLKRMTSNETARQRYVVLMPRFVLLIRGDDLDHAMVALNAASIPTIGPESGGFPEEIATLQVLVEADTPEDAEDRVRAKLPEGDYEVGIARLWGASS
jgi:hypothetical protein